MLGGGYVAADAVPAATSANATAIVVMGISVSAALIVRLTVLPFRCGPVAARGNKAGVPGVTKPAGPAQTVPAPSNGAGTLAVHGRGNKFRFVIVGAVPQRNQHYDAGSS